MDKLQLYSALADRKIQEDRDVGEYTGHNDRINRCLRFFQDGILRTDGALIDIGGNVGDLCFALKEKFEGTLVVDISPKNVDICQRRGLDAISADVDISGIPVGDGKASVVTALDLIEHIMDPEKLAREMFRVLRSGGQVYVNTPNIQFYGHLQSLAFGGRFPHTSGDHEIYHGGHLAFFTYLDLEDIFGRAGFKDLRQLRSEHYRQPPEFWMGFLRDMERSTALLRMGDPDLVFTCVKP